VTTGGIDSFRTLAAEGASELVIKRSRFLARAGPVAQEETVQAWLAAQRTAHPDANHHCFAYRLGIVGEIGRFSDDGEPGGTAGRPIMEVLLREAVVDAAVVVTRYFGGILLGAGGLTRAYSQAAAGAVQAAGYREMRAHTELEITLDYALLGGVEQLLAREGVQVSARDFAAQVTLWVPVPAGSRQTLTTRITDLTAGTSTIHPGRTVYLPR
jgi:uncharacterized YigZ family protein